MASTLAFVNKHPELKLLLRNLRQAETQRASCHGDATSPLQAWHRGVQAWHQESLVKSINNKAAEKDSSTLKLIARACRHATSPKFTATCLPNSGPNQIRLRLWPQCHHRPYLTSRISESRGINCLCPTHLLLQGLQ
jgi:hypothetical protein